MFIGLLVPQFEMASRKLIESQDCFEGAHVLRSVGFGGKTLNREIPRGVAPAKHDESHERHRNASQDQKSRLDAVIGHLFPRQSRMNCCVVNLRDKPRSRS